MQQQNKTLGHLIKAPADDLMRRVPINEDLRQIECPWRRRAGRPRMKWVHEDCKYAYSSLEHDVYDSGDEEKVNTLRQHANQRHF